MVLTAKVPFYSIMLRNDAALGTYLVDSSGMTLYYFTKDAPGKSNATAAIIANWPPLSTGAFIVPSTLNASDFGTITRDDGTKQATYKGWPLYHFIQDQVSGDTKGQGLNGIWFVINPANFPPATTASSSAPSGY